MEDSIAVRYFVADQKNPQSMPGSERPSEYVTRSPDGKYFFVITRRGVLKDDNNTYELLVYETAAIDFSLSPQGSPHGMPPLTPTASTIFASTSSTEPAISGADWQPDSSGVTFCGMSSSGGRQYYCLNVSTGKLEQLTHAKSHVSSFAYKDGGYAYKERDDLVDNAEGGRYPVIDSAGYERNYKKVMGIMKSYVGRKDSVAHQLKGDNYIAIRIAPGGRRGIAIPDASRGPDEFVLVNMETGKEVTLSKVITGGRKVEVNASASQTRSPILVPVSASPDAFWLSDGIHVLLINARLVPESDQAGKSAHYTADLERYAGDVICYNIIDGECTNIAPLQQAYDVQSTQEVLNGFFRSVTVVDGVNEAIITYEASGGKEMHVTYAADERGWKKKSMVVDDNLAAQRSRPQPQIELFVRQNENEPPSLYARKEGRERNIIPQDKGLEGIWIAPVHSVKWVEGDGQVGIGGLMLPRNVVPGASVPLVIQSYHYFPDKFLPDGAFAAAYAAQVLVAHGIAVLQIGIEDLTEAEYVSRLDAAVNSLAASGLVDPFRVGVTGFSAAGSLNFYAITHPGCVRLAAAVISDSAKKSFSEYLTDSARESTAVAVMKNYESAPGGKFWEKKAAWLEHEPTFNMDRVRTPALFFQHTAIQDVYNPTYSRFLSIIGAFRRSSKPLDFMFLPYAYHYLFRPRERIVEMEALVDWMCFWLKGEIPVDPDRAARWAILRKQQDEVLKTPPPPKGKWMFVPDAQQPAWTPPTDSKPAAGTGTSSVPQAQEKKPDSKPEPEPAGAGKN